MVVYYFTGMNMTALLVENINPGINVTSYNGRYKDILPYLIEAFDNALISFESHINNLPYKMDLIDLVRMLCYPVPEERGHPINRSQKNNQYSLERFVTKFNVLAKKAEYSIIE